MTGYFAAMRIKAMSALPIQMKPVSLYGALPVYGDLILSPEVSGEADGSAGNAAHRAEMASESTRVVEGGAQSAPAEKEQSDPVEVGLRGHVDRLESESMDRNVTRAPRRSGDFGPMRLSESTGSRDVSVAPRTAFASVAESALARQAADREASIAPAANEPSSRPTQVNVGDRQHVTQAWAVPDTTPRSRLDEREPTDSAPLGQRDKESDPASKPVGEGGGTVSPIVTPAPRTTVVARERLPSHGGLSDNAPAIERREVMTVVESAVRTAVPVPTDTGSTDHTQASASPWLVPLIAMRRPAASEGVGHRQTGGPAISLAPLERVRVASEKAGPGVTGSQEHPGWRFEPAVPVEAQSVLVSIGRIEIRERRPPSVAPAKRASPPRLGLRDYLDRRLRGARDE